MLCRCRKPSARQVDSRLYARPRQSPVLPIGIVEQLASHVPKPAPIDAALRCLRCHR